MSLGDLSIGSINGGAIGAKNTIINGNFGINQRGVSGTVTLSAGDYGHDRWKAGASGCTYTFATSNNVTTITITAGSLMQVIEGINLQSGTHTLSWAGTAQGRVDAGSYGDSGLTGTAVGGTNQTVEFGTGTVSLVQYEAGSVATPFERRSYGQELALCQRYYYKWVSTEVNEPICMGYAYATTAAFVIVPFPVTMRVRPTALETTGTAANYRLLRVNAAAITCSAAPSYSNASTENGQVRPVVASGLTSGEGIIMQSNATGAFLAWSAEL